MRHTMRDIKTMFWRCMMITLRTPEALVMSVVVPAILLTIFVFVFGGSMDVGDYNIVNFLVPGILVNSLVQASSATGIGVNKDMTTGVVTRLRSMAISNVAFLTGHVMVDVIKTIFTTSVVIGVAFLIGFRPVANFPEWLMIIGIMFLFIFANTWLAVWLGVKMKDAESVGGIISIYAILVFLSPGMAPTETMPTVLRVFSENQPMAPFINTLRALMNGYEVAGNDLQLTLLWWGGILVVTFLLTIRTYKKKLTV